MVESRLYKKLKEDKKVQCETCRHSCVLAPGQVGICGVRKNNNGTLEVLNYKKAVAVNIDPIEKKPLFHFQPTTKSLSMATAGCNFSCDFCQNADISQITKKDKARIPGEEIEPEIIVRWAKKKNCSSIAYTYTEPTIFLEYAQDIMKLARKEGLKNIWVTNGYMSKKALAEIAPLLDAAAVDLKAFSNDFYKKICKGQLKPVLENIELMKEKRTWLEIITLVIPGENDSEKELTKIADFILKKLGTQTPWHISRFRPAFRMSDKKPTSLETIKKAYKIGTKAGLEHVYGGNIMEPEMTNTYCPSCGEVIIERAGFQATRLDKEGKCPQCGAEVNIVE